MVGLSLFEGQAVRSASAPRQQVERQLVAIVAADIAEYSRLMGADEEGTLAKLKACRRELIEPGIGRHNGRIVKTTGDGFLIEFSSPVEAVRYAVELQQGLTGRNADVPDEKRIRFRIGINLGDVIVDEKDLYGDAVNIAARLETLAEPGGICISRAMYDQIRDRLALPFADGGEQSVRNIARPIGVYTLSAEAITGLPKAEVRTAFPATRPSDARRHIAAVALAGSLILAGAAWWLWTSQKMPSVTVTATPVATAALPAPRLSIVVLPFANLSTDLDQGYFADGITEDLTTELSRLSGSLVISRNTAFTYKGKPVNAKQIGQELGVRYVLEGSVQRSGNRVRVNAQLIDAETDAHLWAERFEHDIGDLFALQTEIAARTANALSVELVTAATARPTANPDALDYFLRGRAAFNKGETRNSYIEAIGLFERALALDPGSVSVQISLANVLMSRVLEGMTDSAATDVERAGGLIAQALAASPQRTFAHFVKGQLLRHQNRCAEASVEYETVLAVDPNSTAALINVGRCRVRSGLLDEAIAAMEQSIRLSPRDPFIASRYGSIGEVHLLQSRIDEAIRWLEKARSAGPGRPRVYLWLASAHGLKGETERAAGELAEARNLAGEGSYPSIAGMRPPADYVPKIHALYETTYLAGLRSAGMREE